MCTGLYLGYADGMMFMNGEDVMGHDHPHDSGDPGYENTGFEDKVVFCAYC